MTRRADRVENAALMVGLLTVLGVLAQGAGYALA